ncbi:hypothetical protein Tco_0893308 [Tanacetum coccineum]|uniref:Uncharacterized protein n=1 Tax=Tanacetum coccineum TaxID=301880 RepID=A0ABQ5CBN0_9ASTR
MSSLFLFMNRVKSYNLFEKSLWIPGSWRVHAYPRSWCVQFETMIMLLETVHFVRMIWVQQTQPGCLRILLLQGNTCLMDDLLSNVVRRDGVDRKLVTLEVELCYLVDVYQDYHHMYSKDFDITGEFPLRLTSEAVLSKTCCCNCSSQPVKEQRTLEALCIVRAASTRVCMKRMYKKFHAFVSSELCKLEHEVLFGRVEEINENVQCFNLGPQEVIQYIGE